MAENDELLLGRNSVMEALKSGRPINKILIAKGERHGAVREIIGAARAKGLVIQEVEPGKLDIMTGRAKHQGVLAMVAPVAYVELEEIMIKAHSKEASPLFVLLDEIEDPHNVGAILRTADATGVDGVLIPKRRSCPLSATVAKTSAGAVEYVPVARIGNVTQTLEGLKKQGLWIVGADMDGDKDYFEADLTGPVVVVVGNEGKGIGRATKEHCDILVRIPMIGKISSLNASVACSLLLYEIYRQRQAKKV